MVTRIHTDIMQMGSLPNPHCLHRAHWRPAYCATPQSNRSRHGHPKGGNHHGAATMRGSVIQIGTINARLTASPKERAPLAETM